MRPPAAQLHRILESGIQAPSAENKHYLRFRVSDESVQLLTTDRTTWFERPHRRMLALLSYGAVIENIALRSAELQCELTIDPWPDADQPDLVADLRWSAIPATPDPLVHAIEDRHTNRRFYRRAPIGTPALAHLSAAVDAVPGATLLWLDDPRRRALALKAIRIAETERFRCRALHDELFGAIRFELGWQDTSDEWLPPAALQVEAPMRAPFAVMRRWGVMRTANWFGAHVALGLRAGYLPCALAPHLGLILARAPREDLENLQAGRAFERVWLAATAQGIALQPMAAPTALVRQSPGRGWVRAHVRAELEALLGALPVADDVQPYMLFRVGRAAAPSVVTGRRPLADYLD